MRSKVLSSIYLVYEQATKNIRILKLLDAKINTNINIFLFILILVSFAGFLVYCSTFCFLDVKG
jgi:pilus assembly protein TadC